MSYIPLLYSTSIPTSGYWQIGDKVYNSNYSTTNKLGWSCITTGYACGTEWVATTAVTVGTQCSSYGHVYQCTVAGTTSSTAPTHTSGSATDGTVTWLHVGTQAIFKGFSEGSINNTVVVPGDSLVSAFKSWHNVDLTDGVYNLTSDITSIISNLVYKGKGKNTIIDGANTYKIKADFINNVEFRDITFRNFLGFESYGGSNISFVNCKFINVVNNAINFNVGSGINKVQNCYFENIGTCITTVDKTHAYGLGVTASGTCELIVEDSEFTKTHGDCAIMLAYGYNPKITVRRNKFHDTYYGAVKLFSANDSTVSITGEISDNILWNIGTLNVFSTGIGASAIYSGTMYSTPGVNVFRNSVINATENAIEGAYGSVENNYIESTGINTTLFPTPSTEGIYCPHTKTVKNNHVKNAGGRGILAYDTFPISDLKIMNNLIECDTINTAKGIELNSAGGYTNVTIKDNTIVNFSTDIYFNSNYTATNVSIDYGTPKVSSISASGTLHPNTRYLCDATAGSLTLTLPDAIGQVNDITLKVKVLPAGNSITVKPYGTQTVESQTSIVLSTINTAITLCSDGANWIIL